MISPSNSLNRVKIMPVILLIKLSEAPSSHSHPELVSRSPFPNSVSFCALLSPIRGSLMPSDFQIYNAEPVLSPELPTHSPYDFWTFPLGQDTSFPDQECPKRKQNKKKRRMSKTNSSGSYLCLQSTLGPMRGCVLWNQVRKLFLNNPLYLHSNNPLYLPLLYFLRNGAITQPEHLIRNSEVILHCHPILLVIKSS